MIEIYSIYVVMSSVGEYSDRTDNVVCSFASFRKAELFVARMEELNRINIECHQRMYQENPTPDYPKPDPAASRGYDEHWDDYQARVEPIRKSESEARDLCYNAWRKQREDWVAKNYVVPDHLKDVMRFEPFDQDQHPAETSYTVVDAEHYEDDENDF